MIKFTPTVAAFAARPWEPSSPNNNWHKDPSLQRSLQYCKEQTKHFAKSFYFCSHLLTPAEKQASYAVYAFCRYVDDVIDEAERPVSDGKLQLEKEITSIYAGDSSLPFAHAFRVVLNEYKIPRYLLDELVHGCCLDQTPQRLNTFEELEEYCYYVASVVGLMMSKVFGLTAQAGVPYAISMGIAMQLTNILRDIQEDAEMGRRYIPEAELSQYGLPESHLSQLKDSPEWRAFMQFQIKRARHYYQMAEQGIPYLQKGTPQWTTKAMGAVYGGILEEIERQNYNVFDQRASTSMGKKIGLLLQGVLK